MKIFLNAVLVILVFLAVSSGVTKTMLMPQDVEFFGSYGFTNTILIVYGAAQLIGGVLLAINRTRFCGAAIVAITFIISAVVLFMAEKMLITVITLVAVLMLGIVMRQNLMLRKKQPTDAISVNSTQALFTCINRQTVPCGNIQ